MLLKVPIRLIGRSQKHSFRSIMGFALIITMIIAISGVISGFSSQIFGITAQAGNSQSIYIAPSSESNYLSPILPSVLNHTNIAVVLPVLEKTIDLISTYSSYKLKIIGLNLSTLFEFFPKAELIGGTLPISNTTTIECLIGGDIQSYFPSFDIFINQSTEGLYQNLHVAGIIQNVKEFQHCILLELDDYQTFFNTSLNQSGFQRVKVLLKNGAFVHDTISDLQSLLKNHFSNINIKPEKQADIFTSSMFTDILKHLNFLFIFLFIIALIRIFHSISWFLTSYERDFLIMRSCGLSSLQLLILVGILALIIGNFGLIIGVLLGLITPSIIFSFLSLFFQGSYIIPDFSFSILLTVTIISNIIIILAATFPAVRLSITEPNRLSIDTRGLER